MQISADATLVELAEEPGLWIPLAPPSELIVGDGWRMVTSLRSATVERIRLAEDTVATAVEDVRGLARERGLERTTWWVGDYTTPNGLATQLEAHGFEPEPNDPQLTSLTIAAPPGGESAVEVRRIDNLDDYLRGLELDWEVWRIPADERAEQRIRHRKAWPRIVADRRVSHYAAYLDGEPVGFGRAVFTPWAGLLMGGAVLPHARGRGVYRALVYARWDEAVERGVPRLLVSAGAMSTPILERLGFGRIGQVLLLRDRL